MRDSARTRHGDRDNIGHAFGYMKAATNLACVNLFVMPYNYERLLPLLGELVCRSYKYLCFDHQSGSQSVSQSAGDQSRKCLSVCQFCTEIIIPHLSFEKHVFSFFVRFAENRNFFRRRSQRAETADIEQICGRFQSVPAHGAAVLLQCAFDILITRWLIVLLIQAKKYFEAN